VKNTGYVVVTRDPPDMDNFVNIAFELIFIITHFSSSLCIL